MIKVTFRRKILYSIFLILITGIVGTVLFEKHRSNSSRHLPAYFSYTSEELKLLESLRSKKKLEIDHFVRWDEKAFDVVSDQKPGNAKAARFYAYLMTAQRDAANLSFNIKGRYQGSIDPLSKEIICEFFPEKCEEVSKRIQSDKYSEALSDLIMVKVNKRMIDDKKQERPYPVKGGIDYWAGVGVHKGKTAGSWKPWVIDSVENFRLDLPPAHGSQKEKDQLDLVRRAYENLTDHQKRMIVRWAGGAGTKRNPGIWLEVAGDFMKKKSIPLGEFLLIRSALAMGLADSYISSSDNKYVYWGKRPHMIDPTIQTYMPTPNHPSYPSNAGSAAGVSVYLLSHFFPNEKENWEKMGFNAKYSRVWSGIHFPHEVNEGYWLGEKVGKVVVNGIK